MVAMLDDSGQFSSGEFRNTLRLIIRVVRLFHENRTGQYRRGVIHHGDIDLLTGNLQFSVDLCF